MTSVEWIQLLTSISGLLAGLVTLLKLVNGGMRKKILIAVAAAMIAGSALLFPFNKPRIEVESAETAGIRSVAPAECPLHRPCEGLARNTLLQVKLNRDGYASAFLRDQGGNFYNQNGRHIVVDHDVGAAPLWPGTDSEISHADFQLFVVTSYTPFQTFPPGTPLAALPKGTNGHTWGPVHLRVSRDCGAKRCPEAPAGAKAERCPPGAA